MVLPSLKTLSMSALRVAVSDSGCLQEVIFEDRG